MKRGAASHDYGLSLSGCRLGGRREAWIGRIRDGRLMETRRAEWAVTCTFHHELAMRVDIVLNRQKENSSWALDFTGEDGN